MAICSEHRSRWPVLIFRGAHPENAHGIPEAFSPKSVQLGEMLEHHLDGFHNLLDDFWNNWRPKPKSLLVTYKGRCNVNNITIKDSKSKDIIIYIYHYHDYHMIIM